MSAMKNPLYAEIKFERRRLNQAQYGIICGPPKFKFQGILTIFLMAYFPPGYWRSYCYCQTVNNLSMIIYFISGITLKVCYCSHTFSASKCKCVISYHIHVQFGCYLTEKGISNNKSEDMCKVVILPNPVPAYLSLSLVLSLQGPSRILLSS